MLLMNRIYRLSLLFAGALLLIPPACGKKQPDKSNSAAQPGAPSAPRKLRPGLWIMEPADSSHVEWRPLIFGTISDKSVTEILVVVRAAGTEEYWAQPLAAIQEDGVWGCQPYVGLTDTKPGTMFEVRAFARPDSAIAPGAKLDTWPQAALSSNTVSLIRQ
jgi:hypothetical protein